LIFVWLLLFPNGHKTPFFPGNQLRNLSIAFSY
jgi:hypothetical protein